jgi:hypothetical protein
MIKYTPFQIITSTLIGVLIVALLWWGDLPSILEVLLCIILSSLVGVGFFAAAQFEGDEAFDTLDFDLKKEWSKPTDVMVLWWVRYYGGRYIPPFWTKPVYSCLTCMGSLHSIAPTLIFSEWYLWPLIALGTAGVNYLIQTVGWK